MESSKCDKAYVTRCSSTVILNFVFFCRYDISFKSISGEAKSVTEEMTAAWLETTLPTILSRYPLENIFNGDEFGLFFQCLPNKTFHFKKGKCSGGKHSKVRLTGMAAGNAKGERLPIFTIGKPKNPRCFKGVKRVPCRYRTQQKSWMSSELFEEWVKELDRIFGSKKRKITLIIDNCPAHPVTTSVTQTMDQGVIRGLKAKYRSLAIKKQITALEKGSQLPKCSILTAMSMLTKAWNSIPNGTFTNCFKKSGISEVSMERVLNDDDDPFASLDVEEDFMEDLKNDIEVMKEKFNMNFELTAEELVDIDFEISVTGTVSDADITAEVTGRGHDADDEEDSDNEEQPTECLTKPSFNDVMNFITILEDYSLFSNFGDDLMKALKEVNGAIDLDTPSNQKQSNIEDFFNC